MENMEKEIGWILKEKYHNRLTPEFDKDVRRLGKGEPLDYVIGFTEFLGCKIDLSKRPLIPRPETEYWTGEVIKSLKLKDKSKNIKILDIFSGSGCIGVSIMAQLSGPTPPSGVRQFKNIHVTFAEKDKKFVEQIKINIKINKASANSHELADSNMRRHRVVQSNIFSKVMGKFDYIFANPPYISQTRKRKIQKSVLKYEPQEALFGGNDGFLYINKFLRNAKKYLSPEGRIYMEFDYIQKKGIEKLLKKYGYQNWEFHRDQYKKWRWVSIDN